jgi:glutamate dehydrogenase/leucine dehydrogenase
VVTGKPVSLGGSLGRNEATGRGVYYTTQCTCEHLRLTIKGATVVVQGFGNAGTVAAHLLDSAQAYVVAVSDTRGCVYSKNGLDIPKLMLHKERTGSVVGFAGSEPISPRQLLSLECDILIPAALENAIEAETAPLIKARIVAEAANGPVTPEADLILESKGIFVIPDILCNAGGVTVSYFEWVQDEQHLFWDAQDVYHRLERVMKTSFQDVLKVHMDRRVSPRVAANMLGIGRVAEAIRLRGLYP